MFKETNECFPRITLNRGRCEVDLNHNGNPGKFKCIYSYKSTADLNFIQ